MTVRSHGTGWFKFGSWNADCDVCGQTYKAEDLKLRWDGLRCCPNDWELRNPQDFVRGVPDIQAPPWTRPEPADSFVPVFLCTGNGASAIPNYAVPNCLIPSFISPLFTPIPPEDIPTPPPLPSLSSQMIADGASNFYKLNDVTSTIIDYGPLGENGQWNYYSGSYPTNITQSESSLIPTTFDQSTLINPSSLGAYGLAGNWNGGTAVTSWSIEVYFNSSVINTNQTVVGAGGGFGIEFRLATLGIEVILTEESVIGTWGSANLADGNTHQVVLTGVPGSGVTVVTAYIDGVQVGSANSAAPVQFVTQINFGFDPASNVTYNFQGTLQYVGIYKYALSSHQVATHYTLSGL